MSSVLNQHVLVLNRLWQVVNVCTARRALTLLFQGHAQAVLNRSDGSFQTYNFTEWHDFSRQEPHPETGVVGRQERNVILGIVGQFPAQDARPEPGETQRVVRVEGQREKLACHSHHARCLRSVVRTLFQRQ